MSLGFKFQVENEEKGLVDITQELIKLGANANFLNIDWLENHYRLVVWKLASLGILFNIF